MPASFIFALLPGPVARAKLHGSDKSLLIKMQSTNAYAIYVSYTPRVTFVKMILFSLDLSIRDIFYFDSISQFNQANIHR